MTEQLRGANNKALQVIAAYQNIKIDGVAIKAPYYINRIEPIYRETMHRAGVNNRLIDKTIEIIRSGKTPIGRIGGKELPEEITQSVQRLSTYLLELGVVLSECNPHIICEYMKMFHIGVDCSGFVYNVLAGALDRIAFTNLMDNLAWTDNKRRDAARASVAVFNSPKLQTITDMTQLQPLDLCINSNNSHIGIFIRMDQFIYLAESSFTDGGIITRKIHISTVKKTRGLDNFRMV